MDSNERTRPHRRVEKFLEELGLNYVSEFNEFQPYQLDIYLPEWHLAVEVDGPYHRKKHDKVRDQWMRERYGVETLRLSLRVLTKNKVQDSVVKFIEQHADTTEARKQKWLLLLSVV